MKYANQCVAVGHNGATLFITDGDEFDDKHPVVVAHPDWFTDTAPEVDEPAAKPKRGKARG